MLKKSLCLSLLAASLASTQAPLAFADHKGFDGGHVQKMVYKLDLTADQKTKIEAIREQSRAALMPIGEKMHALRVQINESFANGTMDEAKINDMINQEKELFGDALKVMLIERRDISNILTPEQKTKLAEMIKKWEEKHHMEKMKDHDKN